MEHEFGSGVVPLNRFHTVFFCWQFQPAVMVQWVKLHTGCSCCSLAVAVLASCVWAAPARLRSYRSSVKGLSVRASQEECKGCTGLGAPRSDPQGPKVIMGVAWSRTDQKLGLQAPVVPACCTGGHHCNNLIFIISSRAGGMHVAGGAVAHNLSPVVLWHVASVCACMCACAWLLHLQQQQQQQR
jgi:hypothetical protein